MCQKTKHIAVIGGGITGLTAAYELHKRYAAEEQSIQITLLEESNALGGAIQTLRRDGFIIEKGPDSFLSRKPAVLRLTKDLGLVPELVGLSPGASKSFIYLKGKLHPTPAGLAMGIPTQIKPFAGTRLLSLPGKIRAAFDLLLPRKGTSEDESLGSLIERRLGAQVADRLVGPILAGIYAGDLHELSTAATFPQLLDMENENRSLILGMLASRKMHKTKASTPDGFELPPSIRGSMFLSYSGGLCTLVDRLKEALMSAGVLIRLNQSVQAVTRHQETYHIHLSDQSVVDVDGIIMAVPAEQASNLLQGSAHQITNCLTHIPSVSVANVVLAFDHDPFKQPLQGSGFVVPRQEGLLLTACTWTSSKWRHTAPPGKVLIRAYVGHWGDQSHQYLTDRELVQRVQKDLFAILGERAVSQFTEVTRHPSAMSQYLVGHTARLKDLEEELRVRYPHLIVAGRSYRGVGIPDCIAQGAESAERLFQQLRR
ncbi:protoporphyrinogen oxidase [Paenibacillus oryzisoli]|uniref:protoporphyrinogen oxidase n=1 Tax=Paenibacillus oryzisoli TaxID=1850517 RepID=UPI003D2B339E